MDGLGTGLASARARTEVRVPVRVNGDVVAARHTARECATAAGLSSTDAAVVATAVSELTRNIVSYAGRGEVILRLVEHGDTKGIEVIAVDRGPGIEDLSLALREGYSTSGALGWGLPGVRRLMDEFDIVSSRGRGTTVTARKWRR